jgi:phosphoglycolate phosphatase
VSHLVVFDLDGTLIDSRFDLAESTNEMLESYGARALPVDAVAAMVGEGARVLVQRALGAAGLDPADPDALGRFRVIYDRRLLDRTRPYDGITAVVEWASARASLAVLTNKPEPPTHRLLDAFGLARYFPRVIGGDAAFPRKPDPAALQFLMKDAGTAPATTLMVGDSMIDIETAHRAGTPVCVAMYGFGKLRGELVLRGEELLAETPADVGLVIERFLS